MPAPDNNKEKKAITSLIENEISGIRELPLTGYFDIVDAIYRCVHENKGKVVVSGLGKAGHIGFNISMTLSSTGTPSVFLNPGEAQHGDIGILQENDILLLISNSGKTREILELIMLSKNIFPHIPIIALTGNKNSELGKKADHLIDIGKTREICPLGLAPTVSTTKMTVVGDLLVVLLMKKINFTSEQYGKLHHGGYLGEKTKKMNYIKNKRY